MIPKTARVAVAVLLVVAPMGACGAGSSPGSGRTSVVAGFYPIAFLAERLGGPGIAVHDLTPAGAEPHDLELNARQVDAIEGADLVAYLGLGFQPQLERALKGAKAASVDLLIRGHLREGGDEAEGLASDPHIWLDPIRMKAMAERLASALRRVDPALGKTITARLTTLRSDLDALDEAYRTGLATCARREIVTAHSAFGYLGDRYGLKQQAIAGFSPEAEPDPRRLAELAALVHRDGVTTIFTETLVSPRVAEALAREASVGTDVLDPIEGLTRAQRQAGESYLTVMAKNLARLRAALGCD